MDYERAEYICPFCGNEQIMKVVVGENEISAFEEQHCNECDEVFDVGTWELYDEEEDEYYEDEEDFYEDDEFIERHGLFLNEEDICDEDYDEDDEE